MYWRTNDLALVSSKFTDIQAKTMMLKSIAGRVGLSLKTRKCKTMRMNVRCERRVKIGEEEVKDVQKFGYLGAVVSNTSGTTEDIKSRLNKARMTYGRLGKIRGD